MALANQPLIDALRETANRLRNGAPYSWGNHGTCNCGNLLQVITEFDAKEILRYAHTSNGEWTELSIAHCEVTGVPVDLLISKLQDYGLTPSDIHCIEYLEDKQVLERLEGGFRWLSRNVRKDVIEYFETFADMLEEKLFMSMELKIKDILKEEESKNILKIRKLHAISV